MALVTLVLEAQEAAAVQGVLKVVNAQKQMEGGLKAIGSAGATMERQVVGSFNKIDSTMRQGMREFENRRKMMERREGRYLAPARLAGADITDADSIVAARKMMADQIRARRAEAAKASKLGMMADGSLTSMDATLGRGQAALDASKARKAAAAEQTALQNEIDLNNFTGRMDQQRANKAKFLERRQKVAQGALMVGAAVAGVAHEAEQQLNQMADTIVRTEDMLTPLYGVGANMGRRTAIRKDIFTKSAGLGIDADKLTKLQFTRQSAASDLAPEVGAAMDETAVRLFKLQGSDMTQSVMSMVGAVQILKGEIASGPKGIRELENKLAYAADVGAFEIDQITPYQSMVLGSFQSMGFKHEDAYASMAMASKLGMRPESYMTGLRNLPLVMSHAEKKLGHKLEGSFGEQMGQIAGMESPEMLSLVGKDPFIFAKYLSENTDLLQQYTNELKKITGDMDIIGAKLSQAYTDPTRVAAEVIKSAKQIQENAPATASQGVLDDVEEHELRKAGASQMPWYLKYTATPKVWLNTVMDLGEESGNKVGSDLETGVRMAANDSERSGNITQAGHLRLKYGLAAQSSVTDAQGKRRYTGAAEAQEFVKMRQTYTDLNDAEYRQWKTYTSTNPTEAANYLGRVGLPKVKPQPSLAEAASENFDWRNPLSSIPRMTAAMQENGVMQNVATIMTAVTKKQEAAADLTAQAMSMLIARMGGTPVSSPNPSAGNNQ